MFAIDFKVYRILQLYFKNKIDVDNFDFAIYYVNISYIFVKMLWYWILYEL